MYFTINQHAQEQQKKTHSRPAERIHGEKKVSFALLTFGATFRTDNTRVQTKHNIWTCVLAPKCLFLKTSTRNLGFLHASISMKNVFRVMTAKLRRDGCASC